MRLISFRLSPIHFSVFGEMSGNYWLFASESWSPLVWIKVRSLYSLSAFCDNTVIYSVCGQINNRIAFCAVRMVYYSRHSGNVLEAKLLESDCLILWIIYLSDDFTLFAYGNLKLAFKSTIFQPFLFWPLSCKFNGRNKFWVWNFW